MEAMLAKLTGVRKVLVTIIAMALATILLVYKQITSDNWVDFHQWLLPAFMASNWLSKMTGKDGRSKEEQH